MKKIELMNVKAWITKANTKSNKKIVIILPEYYSEYYKSEKIIRQWEVVGNFQYLDFLVMSFKRNFNFESLCMEIIKIIRKIKNKYKEIIVVGHSKGGVILQYISNSIKDYVDRMISISVPYQGTVFASPEKMKKILINKKILKIRYGKKIYDFYIESFDGDFADQMIEEDSFILRNLKVNELIQNYVFKVSLIEFMRDIIKLDFESSSLYLIDKLIKLNGDGIVSMKSQYLQNKKIKQNIICGTHKSGYKKVMKIVLK